MGLRNDFLVHKRKTIQSFNFVSADISNINANTENIKSLLASLESKISSFDIEVDNLKNSIAKCLSGINLQQANHLKAASAIESSSNSIKKLFSISKIHSSKNKQTDLSLKRHQAEINRVKNLIKVLNGKIKVWKIAKKLSIKKTITEVKR